MCLGCQLLFHRWDKRVIPTLRLNRGGRGLRRKRGGRYWGLPDAYSKVCCNLLKRNLSCQTPIRVFRVICVFRDSDNKKCGTNFPVCAKKRKLKVKSTV